MAIGRHRLVTTRIAPHILDQDVLGRTLGNALHIDQHTATLHLHIANRHATERGGEVRERGCGQARSQATHKVGRAEHLPGHRLGLGLEAHTLKVEVLATTATRTARLETNTYARTIAHAVVGIDIATPATRLRANRQATHTAQSEAVAHHDTLRGTTYAIAELVATTLHGDIIVATVGRHILHQHIAAAGDIDTIATGLTERRDANTANDNIFAIDRSHIPEGGLLERDTLQIDILAVDRAKEGRQLNRATLLTIEQTLLNRRVGVDLTIVLGTTLADRTTLRRADEATLTRQGDILRTIGVDAGTQRVELHTGIGRKDRRQEVLHLAAKAHRRALLGVEFDVALQRDTACKPITCCERYTTSALLREAVDSLLNLLGLQTTIRCGEELHLAVGKGRLLQLGHVERSLNRSNLRRHHRSTHLPARGDVGTLGRSGQCHQTQHQT